MSVAVKTTVKFEIITTCTSLDKISKSPDNKICHLHCGNRSFRATSAVVLAAKIPDGAIFSRHREMARSVLSPSWRRKKL
jgi:hypothetical protein